MLNLRSALACTALAAFLVPGVAIWRAVAQPIEHDKFPTRPIHIVSPFAAGSISDISLRLFAEKFAARLKGPIVIDNQPRAGGVTAAATVLTAAHDGHTMVLFSTSTAISVSLLKQLPYDPVHDFAPVSMLSTFANIFATNFNSRHATLADLIAAARAAPGMLNIGTTTVGSTNHLAATLFNATLGLQAQIIPYRTPGDLLTAALRSEVDMIVQSYGALKSALADKQIRALATTTADRAGYLPEVPSVQEAGVSGYEVVTWNGFFVPVKTPPEIIQRINSATRLVQRDAELGRRFHDLGLEPLPSTPEELGARMSSEIARWAQVIREAGIEKQ